MAYIDSEHLRPWIEQGRVSVGDVRLCREFHDHLLSLRWLPSRLDWEGLRFDELDLTNADREQLAGRVSRARIGQHRDLLVMYTPDEPGLCCDRDLAVDNLDYLYWKAPGYRYLCGVDIDSGGFVTDPGDFAETDGTRLRMVL
ncbi:hypothetical protein ACQPWR_04505 [Micromonospora vinacea]|uniref:hypothetical protein n=1 Tax=Micromonospora vinacea TaxID=709878 RepID=UPI003D8C726E